MQLGRVLKLLQRVAVDNHWDRLAIAELHDDIVEEHRRLAIEALSSSFWRAGKQLTSVEASQQTLNWLEGEVTGHGRWQRLLSQMEARLSLDLAVFLVAVRALGRMKAVVSRAA